VALLIGGYAVMSAVLTPPVESRPAFHEAHNEPAGGPIKALPDDDDGVDVKIESLDQIGNGPGTIRIKAELFEKK